MESTKKKEVPAVQLESPRFVNGNPLLIAGLRQSFTGETIREIPLLWQRFAPYLGKIPGQVGRVAYGLCFPTPAGCDYLAGVEVSSGNALPGEFSLINLPAQKYAVFPHREHVSKLYNTIEAIGKQWFPTSGHQAVRAAGAPDFFERYGEAFNPQTGTGDMEVWFPVKA